MIRALAYLLATILAWGGYWLSYSALRQEASLVEGKGPAVVIPPLTQVWLYGGDRYLAANIESTRILVTGPVSLTSERAATFASLHQGISALNPCQEDNYYVANLLLAFGGADRDARTILTKASACRYWDPLPALFLGVNLYFFEHRYDEAARLIDLSADRSTANRTALRRLAIMIRAAKLSDTKMAINYLQAQAGAARDPALKAALEKRIKRLELLQQLREAQAAYEAKFGALNDPKDLVKRGLLTALPVDPLGLGYEFEGHRFDLKRIQVGR